MPTAHPVRAERVVLLLGIGTAVSLLGDSTLYTVLPRPEIAAEAGVTLAMVGILLGANRAVRLVTNGIAGVLYDRLPRRPLLIISLFIGALSTLIFAAGRGPAPLLLSRLLWGVAWSGIWVGGNAVVLDVSSGHNRGRLSGQYQMWFFLGTGGAAFAGGVLTDVVGFRQGLLAGSVMTGAAALLWLFVLPQTETRGEGGRKIAFRNPPVPFPWPVAIFAAVPLFVTRFVFAGVVAATLALWLGDLVGSGLPLAAFVVPLASLTGAFVALRALVSLVGARMAGSASDRSGPRWHIVAVVLLVGAVGTWLAASVAPAVAVTGALIASVTAGGVQAVVPAIVGDSSGAAERGRILSVAYTLGDLGSAVGPPLALALVGSLGVAIIYRLCAAFLALAVLFAFWRATSERQHGASAQRP